jgi:hypothetical protein
VDWWASSQVSSPRQTDEIATARSSSSSMRRSRPPDQDQDQDQDQDMLSLDASAAWECIHRASIYARRRLEAQRQEYEACMAGANLYHQSGAAEDPCCAADLPRLPKHMRELLARFGDLRSRCRHCNGSDTQKSRVEQEFLQAVGVDGGSAKAGSPANFLEEDWISTRKTTSRSKRNSKKGDGGHVGSRELKELMDSFREWYTIRQAAAHSSPLATAAPMAPGYSKEIAGALRHWGGGFPRTLEEPVLYAQSPSGPTSAHLMRSSLVAAVEGVVFRAFAHHFSAMDEDCSDPAIFSLFAGVHALTTSEGKPTLSFIQSDEGGGEG